MKQLRYLIDADLYSLEKVKQPNGTYLENLVKEESYKVVSEELDDAVSVSMYGADITSIERIRSVKGTLEAFLSEKMGNEIDNISKYNVVLNGLKYRVMAVRKKGIDIKLIGKFEQVVSL